MGIFQKASNQLGKVGDKIQNIGDAFSSSLKSLHGWAGTIFETAKNGSTFIGIQYSEVGNIQRAIAEYVKIISDEVAKLNTEISNSRALKGQTAEATTKYVKAVAECAGAYVSHLLRYAKRMGEYAEEFKKNDSSMVDAIGDAGRTLGAAVKEFSEKY